METLISKHPLKHELQSYFQNHGTYYDVDLGKEIEFELWKNEDKNDLVNYRNHILNLLSPVEDTITELSLNVNFIRGINIRSTAGEFESILKFFIKNWLFRFVSSYEVLCHFVANCLELVNSNEQFDRKKFSKLKIPARIKIPMVKINALIESKISLFEEDLNLKNNTQKHEGKFDYKNSELLFLDFQVKANFLQNDIDTEIDYGLIRNKIINEICKKDKELIDLIVEVLDSLHPVVKDKLEFKLNF